MNRWVLLACIACSAAQAQSVTITESPGAFSARGPAGWARQPFSTDDVRLKFVSPERTPSAECLVMVKTRPSLRGQSQSDINTAMREGTDAKEIARALAKDYGNVRVISVAIGELSGVPAQTYNVSHSAGTSPAIQWIRAVTAVAVTVPDIVWSVTCAGTGRTRADAQKAFDHWKVEFVKFSSSVKFLP